MRCPHCKNELEDYEFETLDSDKQKVTIHLDRCHRCDGTWFDRGELSAFTGVDLTGHSFSERKAALFSECSNCGADNTKSMRHCLLCHSDLRRLCPRCVTGLEHVKFLGFSIDYCSECFGMWLDSGEARSIHSAVKSETPGRITCVHCGKIGLTLRDSFCSADGPICGDCLEEDDNQEEKIAEWFPNYAEGEGGMIEVVEIIGKYIRTKLALKRLSEED